MKSKKYARKLEELDVELVAMARWVKRTGARVLVVIEGRDTAGKGGVIDAIAAHINPRQCRTVAMGKPEKFLETAAYLKRYSAFFPKPGEIVLFDRSWYNRAGVERVMGYTPEASVEDFLAKVPAFEKKLVDDGVLLFKYWLCCDQEQQEARFAERLVDPLKQWKLSPVDVAARHHYEDYTRARGAMIEATHTIWAPWTLVDFNDQKRGRLTLIRNLLDRLPDTKVDDVLPVFEPLEGKPAKEHYGIIEPLPTWPAKKKD